MQKIHLVITFMLSAIMLQAQRSGTVTDVQQTWAAVSSQERLTDKWGLWTDVQLRTQQHFTNGFSQAIARFGLMYYLNDATKIFAGYAYAHYFPGEGHRYIAQAEHRPWQQLQWHTKYMHSGLMQWIRLEERYRRKIANDSTLAAGYNFNYRIRYNIVYEVPLTTTAAGHSSFSAVVSDEVHFNFGRQIVSNYFDQNRFFAGIKFNRNGHTNLQLGYLNVFQQLASRYSFRNVHVIRLSYSQNFDLRRKKNEKQK